MTTYRPRRLHRDLHTAEPLFLVRYGDDVHDDATSMSITMNRGSQGASSGVTAATCTVELVGEKPAATADTGLSIDLTSTAADILGISEAGRRRWLGRVAAQRVKDSQDARRSTEINAQGWSSQVPLTTIQQRADKGDKGFRIGDMLARAWTQTHVPVPFTVSGDTDAPYVPPEVDYLVIAGNEVWSKWAGDLGMLVRTRRDGGCDALGLYARQLAAETWRSTFPVPLTRRVCLSPTEWVQPVTNPATLDWKHRAQDDPATVVTDRLTLGYNEQQRPLPATELDTSHAYPSTANQARLAAATAYQATSLGYQIETLTVDLIGLARSPLSADRALLSQLMTLEEGDPVCLSWDWPADLAGIYYASHIEEKVTPDAWTLTLDLDATQNITGQFSPDPSGTTWDTRYPRAVQWDQPDLTWNEV